MEQHQPDSFSVEVGDANAGVVRVAVAGELDLSGAPRLVTVLRGELSGGSDVLLDLSSVSFIDSSGLRALLSGMRIARSAGRALTLDARLPVQVRRVLEVTRLERMLVIEAPHS